MTDYDRRPLPQRGMPSRRISPRGGGGGGGRGGGGQTKFAITAVPTRKNTRITTRKRIMTTATTKTKMMVIMTTANTIIVAGRLLREMIDIIILVEATTIDIPSIIVFMTRVISGIGITIEAVDVNL
jgi:hypothetical protein